MTLDDQCTASITKARHHILTQTLAGLPAATVTRVVLTPRVLAAVAHMNAMAETGDLLATQASAQAWNRALKMAIATPPPLVPSVGEHCPDGQGHTWLRRGTAPRLCAHCNGVELAPAVARGL